MRTTTFTFRAVDEAEPGEKWQRLFAELWPDYRRWYLSRGDAARPSFLRCESALRRHMPELLPVWERLVGLAGGGDLPARFLSLYCPPPYLTACSQAIFPRGARFLVRNYDYSPKLFEGIFLRSAWSGRRVVAATDGLIGVLDGMNDAGLAVSLSFGGKDVVGTGFGAPLVLRYVLETCDTTAEATEVLARVPFHMAYNVMVLDRDGEHATVFAGPDAPARVHRALVSTNHQEKIVLPRHAAATATRARESRLEALVGDDAIGAERFVEAFLEPPLHSTFYSRGFGTLYTAVYHPASGAVEYRWPDGTWAHSVDRFTEGQRDVRFEEPPDPHTA